MGIHGVVLGASGYSAAELLRLLDQHPAFEVVALGANTSVGTPLVDMHPHLSGLDLPPLEPIEAALSRSPDVVFSCLPGDASVVWSEGAVVIDLSDAHRDDPGWVYGLTEHRRHDLPADRVANPGCYPTAVLLGLLPFAAAGVVEGGVIVDAVSGYSGAGRSLKHEMLLSSGYGDFTAYGSTEHRHVPEMERGLQQLGGLATSVSFTPHLAPMSRGLLATIRVQAASELDDRAALEVLSDAYSGEPFVKVVTEWPRTKATLGTNSVVLSARVDQRNGWVIVSAALDNLGKGAAGQAVQNANLIFGLDERTGLQTTGVWP